VSVRHFWAGGPIIGAGIVGGTGHGWLIAGAIAVLLVLMLIAAEAVGGAGLGGPLRAARRRLRRQRD
jgi:hypothetical protein